MNRVINELVRAEALEMVPPDAKSALRWVKDAERHLAGAARIADLDPTGSYVLCYDGARKAIAAVLLAYGYRVTSKPGAHAAVARVAESLAANPNERSRLRGLERMRRSRNKAEYGIRTFSAKELAAASEAGEWIVAFAHSRIG